MSSCRCVCIDWLWFGASSTVNIRRASSSIRGGEVISISLGTAATLTTRPPRHIPLRVFGTSGWDPDAYLLPGVDLSFSGIDYNNFSVVVLNLHGPSALLGFHIGGIIGHDFLRHYRVAIDLKRSMLRLHRYEREI